MIVLNMDEVNLHRKTLFKQLRKCIYVYPTDTIYGIGCDATNEKFVQKIRTIKKSAQPFSIIAPGKEWIYTHCMVTAEAEEWIRKLPGPYTLILRLKNPEAIASNVYNAKDGTIGVRIPNHWFSSVVKELGYPIVTTAANTKGHEFMTSLDTLELHIRNNVDYVFYEGEKKGSPSIIINFAERSMHIDPRSHQHAPRSPIHFPLKEIALK